MATKQMIMNVFVPHCVNLLQIGLNPPYPYKTDGNYVNHILVNADNADAINMICTKLKMIREIVIKHYTNSPSFGWIPKKNDTVYWVTVPNQSHMGEITTTDSLDAVNQYKCLGNCYKSEIEAKQLCDQIKPIIDSMLE